MAGELNLVLMGKAGRSDLDAELILDPLKTALIVVDMQYFSGCRTTGMGKKFTEEGQADLIAWRFDRIEKKLIPSLQKLLTFFRQNKLKVIYITVSSQTQDYSDVPRHIKTLLQAFNGRIGSLEGGILKEIEPVPGETIINKTSVGAFASTALDAHLRRYAIEHLLFTGISTCACVDTTARFAADLGYHCVMVEDACSDLRQQDHEWTLFNFQRLFGRVASTDAVMAEMARALPVKAVPRP